MGNLNFILLCLFAILQFADYLTTAIGLGLGYVEKNPIANLIIKHSGIEGFFVYKILVTIGVAWVTKELPSIFLYVLIILNIMYIMVLIHNVVLICKK
jgi:hypothetical protein